VRSSSLHAHVHVCGCTRLQLAKLLGGAQRGRCELERLVRVRLGLTRTLTLALTLALALTLTLTLVLTLT